MRLGSQWSFRRGQWSPVALIDGAKHTGKQSEMEARGYGLGARFCTEVADEYGLEAFVYQWDQRDADHPGEVTPRPFGAPMFVIQLEMLFTAHYVFCEDVADLMEAMSKIVPVVQMSVRTELLVKMDEQREELAESLAEVAQLQLTSGALRQLETPEQVGEWLAAGLGAVTKEAL